MTTLTTLIVAVFVFGYFMIAIESVTKINKAAIALLMFVGCWTLFMFSPEQYLPAALLGDNIPLAVSDVIEKHLGSTATTLFFLMGHDHCGIGGPKRWLQLCTRHDAHKE